MTNYTVYAAWPDRPNGPITPSTADYWQAREWAARFLRTARQTGMTVRRFRVFAGEPVWPNRWTVSDATRKELWSIRTTEKAG